MRVVPAIAAVVLVVGQARAQEIRITGPLAGSPAPSYRATRAFAIGGHLSAGAGGGAGLFVRARPDARLAFDFVGEALRRDADTAVPVTLRLVGFQRLSRDHDFFLALGPTVRFTEHRRASGAEAALGLETILGWSTIRGEVAGFVADDHGTRTQGALLRIGFATNFGARVYRDYAAPAL